MTEHTPTPWHITWVDPNNDTRSEALATHARIVASDHGSLGIMIPMHGSFGRQGGKANIKFIVRAVNCHDELVAALEDCLPLFDLVACGEVQERVEALLTRARSEG